MTTNKYSDKVHHGEVKKDAKFPTERAANDQNLANQKGMKGAIEILTDKQKQDIEKEAIEWEKNRPVYGHSLINGYIAGATVRALACIQKDEEIARLQKRIAELEKER